MFVALLKHIVLLPAFVAFAIATPAQTAVAPTPPLGWNSWDFYGLSVTEAEWKGNVADAPAAPGQKVGSYIAIFNLGEGPSNNSLSWQGIGLTPGNSPSIYLSG